MPLHFIELVALGWVMATPEGVTPVRIEFDAPAGCSSAEAFYAGMRSRTDRVRRAQPGERALGLRIRLSREGASVHGELGSFEDAIRTETRVVDGTSCDEVVDALSFTAALAIDPNARFEPIHADEKLDASSSSGTATEATSNRELAPLKPRRPPTRRSDERGRDAAESVDRSQVTQTPSEPFRVELGTQLAGTKVLSSELSAGAGFFLRLSQRGEGIGNASFGLAFLHFRNDLFTSPERVSARWTGVALSVCPLRFAIGGDLAITPCALALGGWLHARGRNLSSPESADRSWWSAGGALRGAVSLGNDIALELEGGLTLPLVRRRFVTTIPDEPVGQTPEIVPFAALGLAYAF